MNKEEKEKEYKSLTQKYIYKCAGKDTPSRIILQIFTTVVGLERDWMRVGIGGVCWSFTTVTMASIDIEEWLG